MTWDIYGARVTPDGLRLDPQGIPISTAPIDQGSVAVGRGSSSSLVAWTDGRGPGSLGIYAARVMPDGTVPDTDGIAVKTGHTAQWPAVSFDGSNFLVVWEQSGWQIHGARVTPDGTVLDSAGFAVSNGDYDLYADVGFDGTNYLVVWARGHSVAREICGARSGRTGPCSTHSESRLPKVPATDGRPKWMPDLRVSWSSGQMSAAVSHDIYGARVTAEGVVLDPSGIAVSDLRPRNPTGRVLRRRQFPGGLARHAR